MKKIVFIGGPTASGKTNIAVEIAKNFNGELINADSRQIYKYLDIGTNKGDIKNIDGKNYIDDIPIHLVSFLEPNIRYNVFDFKQSAINLIEDIINRGKLPIIVGGTGLYIDSIIKNYQLLEGNTNLRADLEKMSTSELQTNLEKNFFEEFSKLNNSDKLNPRRLVRLLEKLHSPELNFSNNKIEYDYIFIYPEHNLELLLTTIENRVEQMFKNGIVSETKKVLDLGFSKDSVALQGTGYKQVIELLENKISGKKCIELVKTSHKQYAKRQITWFEGKGRNYLLKKVKSTNDAKQLVLDFLNG
jgi:tRNA dimethylallyltransferase